MARIGQDEELDELEGGKEERKRIEVDDDS